MKKNNKRENHRLNNKKKKTMQKENISTKKAEYDVLGLETKRKVNNNVEEEDVKNYKLQEEKESKSGKKNKIVVLTIALILIFIYIIYLLYKIFANPTNTFIVSNGELSQEETTVGYIIREETAIKGQNYKNGMVKIKNEGEKVAKGDSVFRYYSSGENDLKQKIEDIDGKIQEAMEKEGSIFTGDIKLLESQIEKNLNYVYSLNSMQEIEEYKKNINADITKKAKISGELSPAGSYLKELIEERSKYEEQLNAGSEYITATQTGIVSYRVDGLEDVLTPDSFSNIDKEFLENLNLKTGQTVASNEEMGKIVNNYYCYIVFNLQSEEAKNAKINDTIKIRVQNKDETKAVIQNKIEEDDGSVTITIKIEKNVEELISYRKISFDVIWWSAKGYRIPNESIKEIDNLNYVVRNRGGYYTKILVKILKQNDEYSIVESYDTDELKEMGYTTTQIYNMRNISIYDEIVLNPTEEQLK